MKSMLKNKIIISLITAALMSLAVYSISYAAEVSITTNTAFSIHSDSAILSGKVDTTTYEADVWFQYGSTNNFLNNSTPKVMVGLNLTTQNFYYPLIGLTASTTYYYRAVAQNTSGIPAVYSNNILSFTTLPATPNYSDPNIVPNTANISKPIAITNSALFVRENSALLNGTIFPNSNAVTSAWFEWSEDANLSSGIIKSAAQTIGQGNSEYLSYSLINLVLGKTYYYRAVAKNAAGTNYGNIEKFTTQIPAQIIIPAATNPTPTEDNNEAYTDNKTKKENLPDKPEPNTPPLSASALDTLGNALSNTFVDLIIGGLIGAAIYRFISRKKQIADAEDPLK